MFCSSVGQTIDGPTVGGNPDRAVRMHCSSKSPAKPGALECEPLGSQAERAYRRTDVLDKHRALVELCAYQRPRSSSR